MNERVVSLESRIATDFDMQVRALAAENDRLRADSSANARRVGELDATRREPESTLREAQATRGRIDTSRVAAALGE